MNSSHLLSHHMLGAKNGKSIEYIQIYGERNSGTNYLENLLNANLEYLKAGTKLGWKHGFINQPHLKKYDLSQTLALIISKNPYAWLVSMHQKPYHAPQLANIAFSEFIRKEWACYSGKYNYMKPINVDSNILLNSTEMMRERHPLTKQRIENVVHLRNLKNQSFLKLINIFENYYFIRYEDLLLDYKQTLYRLSLIHI